MTPRNLRLITQRQPQFSRVRHFNANTPVGLSYPGKKEIPKKWSSRLWVACIWTGMTQIWIDRLNGRSCMICQWLPVNMYATTLLQLQVPRQLNVKKTSLYSQLYRKIGQSGLSCLTSNEQWWMLSLRPWRNYSNLWIYIQQNITWPSYYSIL